MKQAITLLFILFIAALFISGCSKKPVDTTPVINDSMSENVTVTPAAQNNTVVVDEPVVIATDNTTIANDTIDDSLNTTVIDDTAANDDSVYSQYRDTGLIDESINNLQSLN
jgi:PBP1b-binding outer membrane lipoprotein LpoB